MNKPKKSLAMTLVLWFCAFALGLVIVFFLINAYISSKLNNAFPTIDNVIQYDDDLRNDAYASIPERAYQGASFIVFSAAGETIYASDRAIREEIYASDVEVLPAMDDETYYTVFDDHDTDGNLIYRVFLLRYNDENSATIVDSSVLGKNLFVLDGHRFDFDGHLFDGKSQLSQRVFAMIRGAYTSRRIVEKYLFTNTKGDIRTLVFSSPIVTDSSYSKMLESMNQLWLLAIPILLVVLAAQVILFHKKIKRSIQPFNEALVTYGKKGEYRVAPEDLPVEFHDTILSFSDLVERLEQSQEQTRILQQEKQRMVADISHDLKTPLTVIQGYSGAFLDDVVPEDKKDTYLRAIYDKSQVATELIDSLFQYAKLEHPDFTLQRTEVDLCALLQNYFASRFADIEFHQLHLEIDIPEQRVDMMLDAERFARLLDNLLGNVLKYNPPGTTIYVALQNRKRDVQLNLADDGIGIPDEIRETLFQPFVTGNTARLSGKGTGLGLAIAEKIVRLHGGTIALTPQGSCGYATQIIIRLPKGNKK